MSCFGACFRSPIQSKSEKRTSIKDEKAKEATSVSNAEEVVEMDVESRDQVELFGETASPADLLTH